MSAISDQTSFDFSGPFGAEGRQAPGFLVDRKGVHSFVADENGVDGSGWNGECYVYRRGFAWHVKPQLNQPPNLDRSRLERMAFTTADRVDDVCVFLNGKRIGKGRVVRVEFDGADRSEPTIRVNGRVVAKWTQDCWHRVDRQGQVRTRGRLTVGPASLYGEAAQAQRPAPRFRPQPRLRLSALCERAAGARRVALA